MRSHARAQAHARTTTMKNPIQINVLIACEESQAECEAFRNRGFNAYSCDIQPCKKNGHKEWHIQGDVSPLLNGKTNFITMDGKKHRLKRWHLIIAHPPCTYLCKMSSVHMVKDGVLDKERYEKMCAARQFFQRCLDAKAKYVAVENPLPMARAKLPRPSCYVQPYWFGVKYSKKTLYWLKNLPPIMPTILNPNFKEFVRSSRGKYRSRTFPQIAEALSIQWGGFVLRNE